jgi:hypothetical protein
LWFEILSYIGVIVMSTGASSVGPALVNAPLTPDEADCIGDIVEAPTAPKDGEHSAKRARKGMGMNWMVDGKNITVLNVDGKSTIDMVKAEIQEQTKIRFWAILITMSCYGVEAVTANDGDKTIDEVCAKLKHGGQILRRADVKAEFRITRQEFGF